MKNYTYEELRAIGMKYYNDVNFCSVISIATACQTSFGKAFHTMKREGRKTRKGVLKPQIIEGVEKLGFKAIPLNGFEGKQVKSMPNLLPRTGAYMVFIRGHVLTIKEGQVCDWSDGRAHRVKQVFKIERV
jgi:hypothetical protein